ncbi:ATP-dependent chaperone ClpB [Candidatus Arthromitus sp. SFB-2]|nr:ATP-dependent chaperone ClpB [Candidatus Arthromitus sp. SFB-2]
MNKNKIFSLGLASSLFMLGLNVNVNAVESKGVVSSELTNNIYKEFKGYSRIDILGNNYDLSNVDSAVLQIIAKKFDAINGGSLSDDKIKEYQKEIMDLLDDYNKDPKKYENLPVTLDLNPVTFLREEIVIVQNKINSLKAEQDNLVILGKII